MSASVRASGTWTSRRLRRLAGARSHRGISAGRPAKPPRRRQNASLQANFALRRWGYLFLRAAKRASRAVQRGNVAARRSSPRRITRGVVRISPAHMNLVAITSGSTRSVRSPRAAGSRSKCVRDWDLEAGWAGMEIGIYGRVLLPTHGWDLARTVTRRSAPPSCGVSVVMSGLAARHAKS